MFIHLGSFHAFICLTFQQQIFYPVSGLMPTTSLWINSSVHAAWLWYVSDMPQMPLNMGPGQPSLQMTTSICLRSSIHLGWSVRGESDNPHSMSAAVAATQWKNYQMQLLHSTPTVDTCLRKLAMRMCTGRKFADDVVTSHVLRYAHMLSKCVSYQTFLTKICTLSESTWMFIIHLIGCIYCSYCKVPKLLFPN